MNLKQKAVQQLFQIATQRFQLLEGRLNELKESGANETKSTAGDKHETALAMIQIEQANIREQYHAVLNQINVLKKINFEIQSDKVINGSLIKTDKGYFMMSIALGKIIADDISIMALSANSPLGIKLMGLKIREQAEVNGNKYLIEIIE